MTKGQRMLRAQAAARIGVAPDTFSSYVTRGQAPAPVEHIGATPLWDEHEIDQWARTRPGQPGRPRQSPESPSRS